MNRKELIKKYIEFFKSKEHAEIPNASLVPENDPTVLFTTAGMHPLVPFLLGQPHAQGKRLVNVQKCIRTGDIDEVGDTTHHTFFEMLGNWSVGDYFKKEAIEWSYEFLTKVLRLEKERLAVSVFEGDKNAGKDDESADIWRGLKIPEQRIVFLGKSENWWGPAGKTGPCGPDTEMFYWKNNSKPVPLEFNPNDDDWVEIWNDVLMQYIKDEKENYNIAKQKNVDTGMGVERVVAILNGLEDDYLGDSFYPIIQEIEKISKKNYNSEENKKSIRIIADHIKASVFIIADGVSPGNTEQGYVLRRLIRRAIRYARNLEMYENFTKKLGKIVISIYDDYEHLQNNKDNILNELEREEKRFREKIASGLRYFNKIVKDNRISGKEAFLLYQSYGFPPELIQEECKKINIEFPSDEFNKEFEKHQELSRTATAGKFKAGLADKGEETTKLHTATHLLLRALQVVLKDDSIIQKGSNITPERLRLDFSYPRKVIKEELQEVEDLVNAEIQKSSEVIREEMSLEEAKKKVINATFEDKYGDKVSVYSINNFSCEICSGPHVKNTSELGHLKIKKETSSSAGVRRIKAVLEKVS